MACNAESEHSVDRTGSPSKLRKGWEKTFEKMAKTVMTIY